jgi:hypothetical protein
LEKRGCDRFLRWTATPCLDDFKIERLNSQKKNPVHTMYERGFQCCWRSGGIHIIHLELYKH